MQLQEPTQRLVHLVRAHEALSHGWHSKSFNWHAALRNGCETLKLQGIVRDRVML
jgi:hypothetical protein